MKLQNSSKIDCAQDDQDVHSLVSIIMPSYNTARYIRESIRSVQEQTYTNWELIIVDDCSADETDTVLAGINDHRIKYLKNERNSGAAVSRNRALREARGRWIAFLDSDDLWDCRKLEKQIAYMEQNDYHFTYTCYREIDSDSVENGVTVSGPKHVNSVGMTNYCWPGCLTVMYDRNIVGLIQIKDIKKNNDYAMWLKVIKKSDCYLLEECLASYRRGRQGSISTHKQWELVKWHYRLYHEAEEKGSIVSVINTCRNIVFGILKKMVYVEQQKE